MRYAVWLVNLLPVLWLLATKSRNRAQWFIAAAFAVSFLADTVAVWLVPWWWVSYVYPVGQASLLAVVMLPREDAAAFTILVTSLGITVACSHPTGPEWMLHTVAFGGVAILAYTRLEGLMRDALVIGFGAWLVGWWMYCFAPSLMAYLVYQSCRALGILVFCKATVDKPVLRVA